MLVLFSLAVLILSDALRFGLQTSAYRRLRGLLRTIRRLNWHHLIQRHLPLDAIAQAWFGRDPVLSPISVWSLV
jgi:hypothetical protein